MADTTEDGSVHLGAAKYRDSAHVALGTNPLVSVEKDYKDAPSEPLFDHAELVSWALWRAAIAEFVAVLIFLYVSISTVIGHSHKEALEPGSGAGIKAIAWSFGGAIFVLVYATAGISGGHLNPAVTFALLLARKVTLTRFIVYSVAQCLGAIAGAGLVKGWQREYFQRYDGGANFVQPGYTIGTGLGVEIVGTFILVHTVFSATDAKRNARDSHVPALVPLPIGFVVFVIILASLPITGTGINPARSFGVAVILNQPKAWHDHWVFWVGPFLGAGLATAYHELVMRARPFKSGSMRGI